MWEQLNVVVPMSSLATPRRVGGTLGLQIHVLLPRPPWLWSVRTLRPRLLGVYSWDNAVFLSKKTTLARAGPNNRLGAVQVSANSRCFTLELLTASADSLDTRTAPRLYSSTIYLFQTIEGLI
jgi:hypothetical protein